MSSARSTRVTSLGRALQFSAAAWRDAWLVLALSVAGPAVMFFGEHGPVNRDLGMALIAGGGLWSALMFAPLTAGLYRVALNLYAGPESRRYPRGLAGLRVGLAEARMLGLAMLMFLLAVLFLAPAALVAAAVAFVFRSQGELSVLAALRYGAYCGLGVLALYPLVAMRVALGGAATVAEDQLRLFQTWPLTQKRLLAVALPATAILALYPLALTAAAFANQAELGEFTLGPGRWPLADALAGAVLSGLFHGALMPTLVVGALTHLYLEWRPQAPRAATRKPVLRVVADLVETGTDGAEGSGDDAGAAPEVASPVRRSAAAFQIAPIASHGRIIAPSPSTRRARRLAIRRRRRRRRPPSASGRSWKCWRCGSRGRPSLRPPWPDPPPIRRCLTARPMRGRAHPSIRR